MILTLAAAALLISERGDQCHNSASCPRIEQIRSAVLDYEGERLSEVQKIWENDRTSPDTIITGPHMFILHRVENIRCVNETKDESSASCSFEAIWGYDSYRENFIADFKLSEGKWKIVDAKSMIKRLKDD